MTALKLESALVNQQRWKKKKNKKKNKKEEEEEEEEEALIYCDRWVLFGRLQHSGGVATSCNVVKHAVTKLYTTANRYRGLTLTHKYTPTV